MLTAYIDIKFKKDITLKEVYVPLSKLFRSFIEKNGKGLKEKHYNRKKFSNYSFGSPMPIFSDLTYKAGKVYSVELRTTEMEFIDLEEYIGLGNDTVEILEVSCGRYVHAAKGSLKTETPLFMKTERIATDDEEAVVAESIRENMIFKFLQNVPKKFEGESHTEEFIQMLRNDVVEKININRKPIGIPSDKFYNNGKTVVNYCLHTEILFKDTPIAKEVEKVVYCTGVGKLTSNGYGHFRRV